MARFKGEGGRRGCFKFGCFGCLLVLALVVGVPALLALVGLSLGSPDPNFEAVAQRQLLPEFLEQTESDQGEAQEPASSLTDLEDLEGGRESNHLKLDAELAPPRPGRVRISMEMGDFEVVSGPPEQGIRLEGDYDEATFDLIEDFQLQDDGSWTYSVELKNKVSWIRRIWGTHDVQNELKLILPRGYPMALEGSLQVGRSEIDLGGLWLTRVDLELKTGEHELRFSEPTARPVEEIAVDGAWGEIRIGSLGNASPRIASLKGLGGEFDVNLEGGWLRDAQVDVQFKFGQCNIRLPAQARVSIDRSRMSFGERRIRDLEASEELPEDAPTLHLELEGAFGEMRVSR